MAYLNSRERHVYLTCRLQELRNYLSDITKHPVFGYTEELRTFLIDVWEEYQKGKRSIDMQIE
jgi:hypothetical protein